MTTTFQLANATLGELTEEFHTAKDELPPSNPCASSTRRNEKLTNGTFDESIKSTRASSLDPPAANEDILISTEQLKFTEAISKAMSEQLAPLIADGHQIRTRPTVYKDTEDGTGDGWLILMRRFLERVHAKSTEVDKA